MSKHILGIDPGLTGSFVLTDGKRVSVMPMPLRPGGKNKEIDFDQVRATLTVLSNGCDVHIFLERAMALAMGSSHAFNYGRGFAALEIAIQLSELPVTYVLPKEWMKIMHDGISADLKPKAKSLIAVDRLFPKLVAKLPRNKNGKLHDGPVDALLIAGYGLRKLSGTKPSGERPGEARALLDFF